MDDGFNLEGLLVIHQIEFVQDNHVGKFNLIDEQISHSSLIMFSQGFSSFLKGLGLVVIMQEISSINHRHHGVES